MSFNVRYGTAKDGDHVWDNRKDAACAMIVDQHPAVFGVQEALDFQLAYFQEHCKYKILYFPGHHKIMEDI